MNGEADTAVGLSKGEVIEVFDCRTSYSVDDVMVSVVVAQIEPKRASEVLQEFALRLPLQEYNLGHMKRVKRDKNDSSILEVLVSPETHYDTVPKDLISMCKPITRLVLVPKLRPLTRAEFEEWGKNWPTIFRPNAVDKERERGFTADEVAQHLKYMEIVNEDSIRIIDAWRQCFRKGGDGSPCPVPPFRGGGIIVNPVNGKVSCDARTTDSILITCVQIQYHMT
jgi:hypothetical protein